MREAIDSALRPIDSLLGKSEKAIQKLSAETWQHSMLQSNIKALRIASALLRGDAGSAKEYPREDLQEALKAVALMLSKSEKARGKFAPGTAHHTLAGNRIHSLQIAADAMERALREGEGAASHEKEAQSKVKEQKYEYTATIQPADRGGAYVAFPYDIRAEFGKGRVKVHATFDGEPYDGSIVNMGATNPDGSVCYIIGILKAIRAKIGKQPGDSVTITIQEREQ